MVRADVVGDNGDAGRGDNGGGNSGHSGSVDGRLLRMTSVTTTALVAAMVVAEATATVTVMTAAVTAGMKKNNHLATGVYLFAKSTSPLSSVASASARHHRAPADRSLDTLASSVTLPLLSNLPPLGLHWAALSNQ